MTWGRSKSTATGRVLLALSACGAATAVGAGAAVADPPVLRGRAAGVDAAPATCLQDAGACHVLLGVVIDGAEAIPAAQLASSYEPYLTRRVSIDDVARIAIAITAAYRQQGYFLSQAIVPEQDLSSGVARIVVVEGRITRVLIEGEASAVVAPYLDGLDTAPIARLRDIERRLTLAGDVPGVRVTGSIRPHMGDLGAHELVVDAALTGSSGYMIVDNRGEAPRRLQLYGRTDTNSARRLGDQASVRFVTTPEAPGDLYSLEAGYSYTFADGGRVTAAFSTSGSRNGSDGSTGQTENEARAVALAYERPMQRLRDRGLWLGAGIEFRHAQGDWSGGGRYADEVRVARLQLRGFLNDSGRATTLLARASFGLDMFGASPMGSDRSRADADPAFATLTLHVSHYRDLGRWFGVYAAADGQWSNAPLLMSEQFYIGGAPYGRGYDFGEIAGDRGAAALVELRAGYDPELGPVSFVQAYVFGDIGEAWRFGVGGDSLASAGGGLRVTFDDWLTAQLELARPLTRTPSGGEDKDWGRYVTIAARY